jgi:hypothetical protein
MILNFNFIKFIIIIINYIIYENKNKKINYIILQYCC